MNHHHTNSMHEIERLGQMTGSADSRYRKSHFWSHQNRLHPCYSAATLSTSQPMIGDARQLTGLLSGFRMWSLLFQPTWTRRPCAWGGLGFSFFTLLAHLILIRIRAAFVSFSPRAKISLEYRYPGISLSWNIVICEFLKDLVWPYPPPTSSPQ